MRTDVLEISEDAVLGGRLRLRQLLTGHRVGHDAILLAAGTGGRAGEHAVDLGAGVGAAGLALAARVPGLKVTLVEIDPALCALASGNAQLNNMADRVSTIACDAEDADALAAAGIGNVDRVLMNPPFHDATRLNLSPDPGRRLAHAAAPGLLRRWVASAVARRYGLHPHQLYAWRKELRETANEAAEAGRPAPLDFVPVVIREQASARAGSIEIEAVGVRVRVLPGVDRGLLADVLRTLKALG